MPRRLQFDLRLGSDSDQRGLRAVAGCDSETQAADGNYRYKRPFVISCAECVDSRSIAFGRPFQLKFFGYEPGYPGDLLDQNQVSRLMLGLPYFYGFDS